jgi:nitroreductase
MNSIFTRRSIRRFTDKKISDDSLRLILTAAMCSPSACNSQPWEYIIVKDRSNLDGIMKSHPYTGMLKSADMAIIVCGGPKEGMSRPYWPLDCAASTQNILLEAQDLGIGSCWCGVYPYEERMDPIRKLFGIPEGMYPFSIIALGYPDEEKPANQRYLPEKIHLEKW